TTEIWARRGIESPAFGAVLAGSLWPVQGPLTFAPIETRHVPASQCYPHHVVAIDIHAARGESPNGCIRIVPRNLIIFRQRGLGWIRSRIQSHDAARKSQHASPHDSVGPNGNPVKGCIQPGVTLWICRATDCRGSSETLSAWRRQHLLLRI